MAKARRFHSRTFGQGLQQRLLAGNIYSRCDSQMGSYAPNADAVNLIGNDEVVDTSITEKEAAMISAMRQADERARQDAIALLELHTGNKKI